MKKAYSSPVVARHTVIANEGLCVLGISQGQGEDKPGVADTREEVEFESNTGKNIWENEW